MKTLLKFVLLNLVILSVSSQSFAEFMSCQAMFGSRRVSKSQVQSDMDVVTRMLRDPEYLQSYKNKRSSNFIFSDFKMVTEQMKKELDQVPVRLDAIKGFPISAPWLKFRAKLLKYKIIFHETLLFRDTAITLAFDFAWIMRTVTHYEYGKNTRELENSVVSFTDNDNPNRVVRYLNSKMVSHLGRKNAFKMAQNHNYLVLPTFANLSHADINYLWANGVMPIGLASKALVFDGVLGDPLAFAAHDAIHSKDHVASIKDNKKEVRNLFEYLNPFLIYIRGKAVRDYQRKSEIIYEQIYSELSKYPLNSGFIEYNGQKITRAEIELLIFQLDHENRWDITNSKEMKRRFDFFDRQNYQIGQIYLRLARNESNKTSQMMDPALLHYERHGTFESQRAAYKWILNQVEIAQKNFNQ